MHTQPVNVEYHCLSSKEKAKSYSHTERNISKEQWEKGTNNLLMLDPSNLNKILYFNDLFQIGVLQSTYMETIECPRQAMYCFSY